MDITLLLNNIARYIDLNKEEEEHFTSLLHHKKLKRKQFILEEGEINTKSTFVTSGCLRSYIVDKNGIEHVLQFAPREWWIVDMRSFITGSPARLNIDALEESEIIYINKTDFDNLYITVPKFERFSRILGQNSLAAYQYRQIDNIALPAMERYKHFCQLYPSLIKSLPQKQVASYIGVTPEFLSKMLNTTLIK